MKKITLLLLVLLTGTAFGQTTKTANASAEIIEAIAITKSSDLVFGTIAPDATVATTVTIAASSGATRTTSDATFITGATSSPAQFDVTASSSYAYSVALSSANSNTLKDGGTNTMTIVYDLPEDGTNVTAASKSFYVGGELTVGANQPAGSYSDVLTITLQYQ